MFIGHFTMAVVKAIVSDYRYFLNEKLRIRMKKDSDWHGLTRTEMTERRKI
jgi:hypothetical protein